MNRHRPDPSAQLQIVFTDEDDATCEPPRRRKYPLPILGLLDCLDRAQISVYTEMKAHVMPGTSNLVALRLPVMAGLAGISTRAVQRVYDALEVKGFIKLVDESRANQKPAVYRLCTDAEIWNFLRMRRLTHWRKSGRGVVLLSCSAVQN